MFQKCLLGSLFVAIALASTQPLLAQRGNLIEGLFRSIVETELEKNQQRELERRQQAERAAKRPLPSDLQPFPTPSLPNRPASPHVDPRLPPAARSGDRRLIAFRESIQQFTLHAEALATNLRRQTGQVPGSRELVGDLLHLQAHSDALARQAAAATRYEEVVDPYCEVDSDWRPLSYQLRSLQGLSPQCSQSISALDQYSNQICKLLGVQTQFDRRRMQELMTVATTYMNALLDDLQLVRGHAGEIPQLIHDGRILEQQLRRENEFAANAELDDIMPRYNDFVTHWRTYAAELYHLNDPHIDLRLERIRQCGSEVFSLMYMPPSPDVNYLFHLADRMERQVGQLLDQLTIRALVRLPAREQNAIVNDGRQLYTRCHEFSQQAQTGGGNLDLRSLQQQFADIDQQWHSLESRLSGIDTLDPASRAGISRVSHEMRDTLGLRETLDHRRALELAASLEGQTEYLNADIQRYRRYYTPSQFGAEFCECSDRFLLLAKQLNSQLANHADIAQLQTSCQELLTEWEHLTENTAALSEHGLSGSRPNRITDGMKELAPIVAELAAMLMG